MIMAEIILTVINLASVETNMHILIQEKTVTVSIFYIDFENQKTLKSIHLRQRIVVAGILLFTPCEFFHTSVS